MIHDIIMVTVVVAVVYMGNWFFGGEFQLLSTLAGATIGQCIWKFMDWKVP